MARSRCRHYRRGGLSVYPLSRETPEHLAEACSLERHIVPAIPGFGCVLIVMDHSHCGYRFIVGNAMVVVCTWKATKNIEAAHIVRC